MRAQEDHGKRTREALRSAQFSALFFGLGMVIWGLAPAVVQRVVSGHAPSLQTFSVGSLTLAVGVLFLVLTIPIGRALAWALKTSLIVSLTVLLGALALLVLQGFVLASIYPLLLSACTAGTSYLALEATKPARSSQQTSGIAQ